MYMPPGQHPLPPIDMNAHRMSDQFEVDQNTQQMMAMSKLVAEVLQPSSNPIAGPPLTIQHAPVLPSEIAAPTPSPSSTIPSSQSTSTTTVIQAPNFEMPSGSSQALLEKNEESPLESPANLAETLQPEPRSRKSSSSSQKSSGKSRKAQRKQEEVIKEYEMCLEQVLTWLLEAEQELQKMHEADPKRKSLTGKCQDHETFMSSLTESQDSVGRVLHRGHQLSQKLNDPEHAAGILNQLLMVNERWEQIRSSAMERQQTLQMRLNHLQREHLGQVGKWLTEFEGIIASRQAESLADTVEMCQRQMAEHTVIQNQIDVQQPSVQRLAAFIAIVGGGDHAADQSSMDQEERGEEENSAAQLEQMLQSIGERWMSLCEWAERRATALDGLLELLENYNQAYGHLSGWLEQRQNELQQLRSAHHLEKEEEIVEQMHLLHKMESSLESEHSSFVQLSQLCSELVQRYEQNKSGAAANKIRLQLDTITQTWDNIVTRLEEHSQMLVRTGKTRLGAKSGGDSDQARPSQITTTTPSSSSTEDKPVEQPGEVLARPETAKSPEQTPEESKKQQQIVEEFVQKVAALEREIQPLVLWTEGFVISTKKEDVRHMVHACQRQLKEIKQVEPCVTQLQVELERIHNRATMNSRQLRQINETFDRFMRGWSKVVSKISESLNALSKPTGSGSDEGETEIILARLAGWLKSANQVVDELSKLTPEEAAKRLAQISQQLDEHQRKSIDYLKKRQQKRMPKDPREVSKHQAEVERLEHHLGELAARIGEIYHQLEQGQQPMSTSTTVVQMKHQPSSSEQESPPHWDIRSPEKRPKPVEQPSTRLQPQQLFVPRQEVEHSPEPAPHEAESLRLRLELEAQAEQAEEQARKQGNNVEQKVSDLLEWLQSKEGELKQHKSAAVLPGNVKFLEEELEKCTRLISEVNEKINECRNEVEKPSTKPNLKQQLAVVMPLIEQVLMSAQGHRNNIVDSLNKTQLAFHKYVKAEEIADKHKLILERLKANSEADLRELEVQLRQLQDSLVQDQQVAKAEAMQHLEELASIATRSLPKSQRKEVPPLGSVLSDVRSRIIRLDDQWKCLVEEVDEHLSCLRKERRKRAEAALKRQKELVKELEEAVKASSEATDAEELSEHLDVAKVKEAKTHPSETQKEDVKALCKISRYSFIPKNNHQSCNRRNTIHSYKRQGVQIIEFEAA
uniref:Dystrophin n=1 Tax=Ditylenchus dipsaci TaxID=166011 RepID=A0A915DTR3_9BILA